MKTNVLGVQYDNVTMAEALDTARALLQRPEASYCVTPNAEMAYEALHDESFRAILNGASLVLPDGAGGMVVFGVRGGSAEGIKLVDNIELFSID